MSITQVTNRDLSIAVLRHFLPILAEERSSGKVGPSGRGSAAISRHQGQQQGQEKHQKRGTYQASVSEEGGGGSDAPSAKVNTDNASSLRDPTSLI
jgi:hypothetical protein